MRFYAYAYACVCVEKRTRMRKIMQWCAIFGVKGFNRKVLCKNTRVYAENARASKVELCSTFGCVRMRKSVSPMSLHQSAIVIWDNRFIWDNCYLWQSRTVAHLTGVNGKNCVDSVCFSFIYPVFLIRMGGNAFFLILMQAVYLFFHYVRSCIQFIASFYPNPFVSRYSWIV